MGTDMRYVFIINPAAGKGGGPDFIIPELKRCFPNKKNYSVFITEKAGHAKDIAKAEAEKGDEVCIFACGGEGTCFEVLNGIVGHNNVSLGVIPCGSANDFLKYFGDKSAFLDIPEQISGEAIEVDLIRANEFYCINCCSVGMDAIVADEMRIFKKIPGVSGNLAYKLSLIKTFLGKIGLKIKITLDGKLFGVKECLFAVCANGPIYGGGFKSAPNASPLDGKLDFTIIEKISKLRIPPLVKVYERGEHKKIDCCTMGNCSCLEIESETEMPINLDGELIHRKKVKFEIVKKAVKFILPRKIAADLLIN